MICPTCKRDNPEHADPLAPGAKPEAGDVSICFACASLAIFTEDGDVRLCNREELEELLRQENIIQAQNAVRESTDIRDALAKAANPQWVASALITEVT